MGHQGNSSHSLPAWWWGWGGGRGWQERLSSSWGTCSKVMSCPVFQFAKSECEVYLEMRVQVTSELNPERFPLTAGGIPGVGTATSTSFWVVLSSSRGGRRRLQIQSWFIPTPSHAVPPQCPLIVSSSLDFIPKFTDFLFPGGSFLLYLITNDYS